MLPGLVHNSPFSAAASLNPTYTFGKRSESGNSLANDWVKDTPESNSSVSKKKLHLSVAFKIPHSDQGKKDEKTHLNAEKYFNHKAEFLQDIDTIDRPPRFPVQAQSLHHLKLKLKAIIIMFAQLVCLNPMARLVWP